MPITSLAKDEYAFASSTVNRPPVNTAVLLPAFLRPFAAARIASGHEAATKFPSSSRTSGVVRRPSFVYGKAKRPLSQFHSSFTSGASQAKRRITWPRRISVRSAQPLAQCSQAVGAEIKSNGRERNRYLALVNAPTGQI